MNYKTCRFKVTWKRITPVFLVLGKKSERSPFPMTVPVHRGLDEELEPMRLPCSRDPIVVKCPRWNHAGTVTEIVPPP